MFLVSSVLSCVTVLACLEINKYSPNVTIALGFNYVTMVTLHRGRSWYVIEPDHQASGIASLAFFIYPPSHYPVNLSWGKEWLIIVLKMLIILVNCTELIALCS